MYNQYESHGNEQGRGFLSKFLVRTGVVKDSAQARSVLIFICVMCGVLIGFILYNMNRTVPSTITQEQIDNTLKGTRGSIQR